MTFDEDLGLLYDVDNVLVGSVFQLGNSSIRAYDRSELFLSPQNFGGRVEGDEQPLRKTQLQTPLSLESDCGS